MRLLRKIRIALVAELQMHQHVNAQEQMGVLFQIHAFHANRQERSENNLHDRRQAAKELSSPKYLNDLPNLIYGYS